MDALSIGAALALTDGAAAAANTAAQAANDAAAAANEAAAGYPNLDKDAVIDRTAFNYAWTMMQAEMRDTRKRLTATEAQLAALT